MTKKIKWRARALDDIERLHAFLKEKNSNAAARASAAILDGARLIVSFPRIGRPMPDETERREWFVTFGSSTYILRYRLDDDDTPIMLRVWHNREEKND